jgi:ribose-phosphate pyrophosphokinase
VRSALDHFDTEAVIVIPDAGAVPRTLEIIARLGLKNPIARCVKKRDSQTGALSGFELVEGDVSGRRCLIVDDLCDGGGTFAGIARLLLDAGSSDVALCVTHGIFSKGLVIQGIERTYCTDSYPFFERDDIVLRYDGVPKDGFKVFKRIGRAYASVYMLPNFVRDHVRALHEAP